MKKLLSLFMVLSVFLSLCTFPIPASAAFTPTLTIDMSNKTGAMRHGSGGFLYGLGSHGTPSANILTPLKPSTAVQKAPDGLQHPTGDVLDVAETFISAGGEQVQIYLQDIYALWPYEQTSFDEYLSRIEEMVPKIVSLRNSNPSFTGKLVYVPFNEPDGIWYSNIGWDSSVQNKFNNHWKQAYNLIKSLDSNALIAGTSCANYQSGHFDSWLSFCTQNNCEPDYITWHELQDYDLNSFKANLDNYRGLENKYGMEKREIIINEYAPQDHCSNPGKLVNWIALFEENKVSGCLPYWHNAGNLNDIAADNNEPNGAWWLYKWYGDMSGETLALTTNTDRVKFYGLASVDENKKSSNVILGGEEGEGKVVFENVSSSQAFSASQYVSVKVEATYWTAFHGVSAEPAVIIEAILPVEDDTLTVNIPHMEANAAYNITVAPTTRKEASTHYSLERKLYEAEDGLHIGNVYPNNQRWTYSYSGGYRLSGIRSAADGFNLPINVSHTGYYRMDLTYSNGYGSNSAKPDENNPQSLKASVKFDKTDPRIITLENTIRDEMSGMYTTYVYLTGGEHTMYVRGTNENGGAFSMDSVAFTYKGGTIPPFNSTFEAEKGDFNILLSNTDTAITTKSDISGFSGSGYITGLDARSVSEGGGVRFTVSVPDNGLYAISLRYCADEDTSANIYLDNTALKLDNLLSEMPLPKTDGFEVEYITAFLQKGINIIDIDTHLPVALDYMNVKKAEGEPIIVEAESGNLSGKAQIAHNTYANGSQCVSNIEGATDDRLTIDVNAPRSGKYKMVIRHSSGELFGAHTYNAQLVDRYASFKVNNGAPTRLYFKNTYSDENWRTTVLDTELKEGKNTIEIFNDNWRSVQCGTGTTGNITYHTLVNYAPNFDTFLFYPATEENSYLSASYSMNVMQSLHGTTDISSSLVPEGDSVTLTFNPDYLEGHIRVSANSSDISHLVNNNSLTYTPTEDTTFTVTFITPENLDNYIKNSSFGSGDLSNWTAEASEVKKEGDTHYASIGTISQTFTTPEGYIDISFNARGESLKVSANEVSRTISLSEEWENFSIRTYTAGEVTLSLVGTADVDEFSLNTETVDENLLYFIDCGDIDPSTLSSGDKYGIYNSTTEQFYSTDPVTGKKWGIADTYTFNQTYPHLLTGGETWPYEYDLSDGEDKVITYRYAKDQDDVTGNGVTYKFELPEGSYAFEVAFYAPSHWMGSVNRKASLTMNSSVLASGIVPGTNAQSPVIIKSTAFVTGGEAILNLKLDSDGNGGPMMSYIKISKAIAEKGRTKLDSSEFAVKCSSTWNNDPNTHGKYAFDGNPSTFFDGISGGYVTADLGYETIISAIGYIPRSGWASRMQNTSFYGSKDGLTWERLFVIPSAPTEGTETIVSSANFLNSGRYRYIKYENPSDYCNIGEIIIYKETGTIDFANHSDDRIIEDITLTEGSYQLTLSDTAYGTIIQSERKDGILSFVKSTPIQETVEQISPTESFFIWNTKTISPLATIRK